MTKDESCFIQNPHLVRDTDWLRHRRQLLAAQLSQHKPEICLGLRRQFPDMAGIPDDDTLPASCYDAWAESLTTPGADVFLRWEALSDSLPEPGSRQALAWAWLEAARPHLSAADVFLCREQLRIAEHNARCRAQAAQFSSQAGDFCEQIVRQFAQTSLDFSDDQGRQPALETLAWDLALVFQDWNSASDSLQLELDFITGFSRQIISRHHAAPRFWELLCIKLDRALCDRADTPCLTHVLSYALEALLSAVPRYDFIRTYLEQVTPIYEGLALPVEAPLLWHMIGASRPQTHFYQNLLRACVVDVRVHALEDAPRFSERLKHCHHEGEAVLRRDWERAQLDWYTDACVWFDSQVQNARLLPALATATAAPLEALSARLSEGVADAESSLRLQQMLACLLEILCVTATLEANPQAGRARLRHHLAMFISPDSQWPLWRKYAEIAAGLVRLLSDEETPELHVLWEHATPLLNSLEPLLAELCRTPLNPPHAAISPKLLPADFSIRVRDAHCLYPREQRRRTLVHHLLSCLPADFQTADLGGEIEACRQQAAASNLAPVWGDLAADLPLLTALSRMIPQLDTLAAAATDSVREQCPQYAAEVGETGMQACAVDNTFTLRRVGQVLLGPYPDADEALAWWWETSVGGYLVHRAQAALEANLHGLRRALQHAIGDEAAVQCVLGPLQSLYGEIFSTHVPADPQTPHRGFVSLRLQGPWQRKLSTGNAPLPIHLDDFTACAEKYQAGGAPQGPLCLDLGSDELAAPLQAQLQALLHSYLVEGDLECALQNMLATISAEDLLHYRSDDLEVSWRQLLALLPEALSLPRSAYWTRVFQQALETFRQAGLGRYLEKQAETLGERLEAHIGHLSEAPEGSSQRQALTDLCRHLGLILQQQPPTLAALNSARYLVEQAMPVLNYAAPVWHVLWQRLTVLCLPELEHGEGFALYLWAGQWDAQSEALPATLSLGRGVFLSEEFAFAEDPDEEQSWRALLSGLLAAAITPDSAPLPGAALAQRLALSSAIFARTDAADWQTRYATLQNAFTHQLNPALRQALDTRHLDLSHLLLRLPLLENLPGLPRISRFLCALSALPQHRQLWHLGSMIRVAETPHYAPDALDRLLTSAAGWEALTVAELKALAETWQAACLYRPLREAPELTPAAQEELAIALGVAALAPLAPDPEADLRHWLFEMRPQLEADSPAAAARMVTVWLAQLRSDANDERLAPLADALGRAWSAAALSDYLVSGANELAPPLVQSAKLKLNEGQRATCARDLGFVLRYLGLYISGLEFTPPARWYWQHVACFLPPAVREETRALLPQLSAGLGKDLDAAAQALLNKIQTELCTVFEFPEWREAPAYRSGKAPVADSGSGLRDFTPLSHVGPHWQAVFAQAVPDGALLQTLNSTGLWPDTLQDPPWHVANLVSAQLAALLAALAEYGGDEEIAWQQVLPLFDEALQQVPAHTLCRAWQALAARLPQLSGEASSVYWHGVLSRGEEMLSQVALGRLLMRRATDCAERVASRLGERLGNAGHGQKCRRDQTLFLEYLAEVLRRQPPTLAALNSGRYLLEMITPFVSYGGEVWELVWMNVEYTLHRQADPAEQIALRRWITQMIRLTEHLPHTRALACAVFHGADVCFSDDPAREQIWQTAFSGLLCAACTPEDAPVPGQALVQRLVAASPVFAQESGESWHPRQQQLNKLCSEHLGNHLQVPLLMRHSQIIATLLKLPRYAEAAPMEGLSAFAALFSGLPYAEALWRSLHWAHSAARPDYVPGVKELLISQTAGWPLPSQESLRRTRETYHAACAFRADFTVTWHKWRLGGLLGKIDSNVLELDAGQRQRIERFLCRLVLQNLPGLPEHAIKQLLFQWLAAVGDALPEQREALVYHLHQTVRERYGEAHPLTLMTGALPPLVAETGAALLLLHDNKTLTAQLLPGFAQCRDDSAFLLHRLGQHLSGLAPCGNPGAWYQSRIGAFLPTEARSQVRPMVTEMLKNLPRQMNPAQVKCVEPLLREVFRNIGK